MIHYVAEHARPIRREPDTFWLSRLRKGPGNWFSRKVQTRKSAVEQARGRRALRDRERGFMQPRRLALGRRNDHAGIGAGDHGLGEFVLDQIRPACEGAVDDRIDLQFGRIRYHRHDVVERDLAAAMRIEREFFQFIARGLAVATE